MYVGWESVMFPSGVIESEVQVSLDFSVPSLPQNKGHVKPTKRMTEPSDNGDWKREREKKKITSFEVSV